MSADPFRRLGLLVGTSALVVAVAVVWQRLGWPAAVATIVLGPALATLLSVETAPSTPLPVDGSEPQQVRKAVREVTRTELSTRRQQLEPDDEGEP